MKLCIRKIYCNICKELVGCQEKRSNGDVQVSCLKCNTIIRSWNGIRWVNTSKAPAKTATAGVKTPKAVHAGVKTAKAEPVGAKTAKAEPAGGKTAKTVHAGVKTAKAEPAGAKTAKAEPAGAKTAKTHQGIV